MIEIQPNLDDPFWSKMDRTGSCWIWLQSKNPNGYGLTKVSRKTTLAHRVAFGKCHGPITSEMFILHRCDNPICCNPNHLFVGNASVNYDDARSKDRHTRGERLPNAKLTAEAVREIRTSTLSQPKLAKQFGVTQAKIWSVIHRKSWAHVKD